MCKSLGRFGTIKARDAYYYCKNKQIILFVLVEGNKKEFKTPVFSLSWLLLSFLECVLLYKAFCLFHYILWDLSCFFLPWMGTRKFYRLPRRWWPILLNESGRETLPLTKILNWFLIKTVPFWITMKWPWTCLHVLKQGTCLGYYVIFDWHFAYLSEVLLCRSEIYFSLRKTTIFRQCPSVLLVTFPNSKYFISNYKLLFIANNLHNNNNNTLMKWFFFVFIVRWWSSSKQQFSSKYFLYRNISFPPPTNLFSRNVTAATDKFNFRASFKASKSDENNIAPPRYFPLILN